MPSQKLASHHSCRIVYSAALAGHTTGQLLLHGHVVRTSSIKCCNQTGTSGRGGTHYRHTAVPFPPCAYVRRPGCPAVRSAVHAPQHRLNLRSYEGRRSTDCRAAKGRGSRSPATSCPHEPLQPRSSFPCIIAIRCRHRCSWQLTCNREE